MNKCQWIQNSSIIPSFLHLWDYLRDLKSLSTPLHSPPPYRVLFQIQNGTSATRHLSEQY